MRRTKVRANVDDGGINKSLFINLSFMYHKYTFTLMI